MDIRQTVKTDASELATGIKMIENLLTYSYSAGPWVFEIVQGLFRLAIRSMWIQW